MEVANPLVIGDVVRLPFASGKVSVIDNEEGSYLAQPYEPKQSTNIFTDDAEFVPVLIKRLPPSKITAANRRSADGSNVVSGEA